MLHFVTPLKFIKKILIDLWNRKFDFLKTL